jgi:hypothetical protein
MSTRVEPRRSQESGAAALCMIARHHGLEVGFADLASLLPTDDLRLDLMLLLHAARALGFEATPLEGGYDELPEVPRPNIVLFRSPGDGAIPLFRVLYEIDARSALVGNPSTGQNERLSRDEFSQCWTGDAVQLDPIPERLEASRARFAERRSVVARFARALGIRPLAPRRWAFPPVAAAAVAAVVAGLHPGSTPATAVALAAVGACLILSTGQAIYSTACRACTRGAALAGALPVAAIGAALYAALLAVRLLAPTSPLWPLGLAAAAGVHLALVGVLARARLACLPCIATALLAWTATALVAASGSATLSVRMAPIAAAGCGLALLATRHARRAFRLAVDDNSHALARRVIAEAAPPSDGSVHLVVYKRPDCPLCAFYEASVRPALEQQFDGQLSIEEREASGGPTETPLIVIRGRTDFVLFGLAPETGYATIARAIELATDGAITSAAVVQ